MKAFTKWSFDRYRPAVHGNDSIYVARIVPYEHEFQIFHTGEGKCKLYYKPKFSEKDFLSVDCENGFCKVENLDEYIEYEFYIEDSFKNHSAHGFVQTGYAPGITVNYLSMNDRKYSFSGQYLCTPCLLCHPNGYMLASMDVFDRRCGQNLTLIFRSDDDGKTWYHLTELFPCFWGTLFMHKGEVYMLSTSTEYGDILIGKSTDGGKNWLIPTVIQRGSCCPTLPGWHKSSGHVTEHKGRLWCAYDYGSHTTGGHASSLISAPCDSDLLDANSWAISDPVPFNPNWEGAAKRDFRGFIEGNAVVGKDGNIYNVLRYNIDRGVPNYGLIGRFKGDTENPEKPLEFDKFIKFEGNHSKFDIVYDEVSGKYWSIVSRIRDASHAGDRNLLSLLSSEDMENWVLVKDLIDYTNCTPKLYGFQYISFSIVGDDIRYLSRTATNGAHTYHDSNYITYHTVENFRNL